MSALSKQNKVRTIRKICKLTQAELAAIVDRARLTIHGIEAGKQPLSKPMAEAISLHTGVSQVWLLDTKHTHRPTCEQDPDQPFTKAVFENRRAQILDPRTGQWDRISVYSTVEAFCNELRAVSAEAHRAKGIIYFYHCTRMFLADMEQRWKISKPTGMTEEEFNRHMLGGESGAQKSPDEAEAKQTESRGKLPAKLAPEK